MDEYGEPPGLDKEDLYRQFASISDDESQGLLSLLTEKLDDIPPMPEKYTHPNAEEFYPLDRWRLENYYVAQELARGGELWNWLYSHQSGSSWGIAVVRDGKVVARAELGWLRMNLSLE